MVEHLRYQSIENLFRGISRLMIWIKTVKFRIGHFTEQFPTEIIRQATEKLYFFNSNISKFTFLSNFYIAVLASKIL